MQGLKVKPPGTFLHKLPDAVSFRDAGEARSDASGTSTESTDTATMRHGMDEGPAGTHSNPIPSAVLSKPGWSIPPQVPPHHHIQAPPQVQAPQQSGALHNPSLTPPPLPLFPHHRIKMRNGLEVFATHTVTVSRAIASQRRRCFAAALLPLNNSITVTAVTVDSNCVRGRGPSPLPSLLQLCS